MLNANVCQQSCNDFLIIIIMIGVSSWRMYWCHIQMPKRVEKMHEEIQKWTTAAATAPAAKINRAQPKWPKLTYMQWETEICLISAVKYECIDTTTWLLSISLLLVRLLFLSLALFHLPIYVFTIIIIGNAYEYMTPCSGLWWPNCSRPVHVEERDRVREGKRLHAIEILYTNRRQRNIISISENEEHKIWKVITTHIYYKSLTWPTTTTKTAKNSHERNFNASIVY